MVNEPVLDPRLPSPTQPAGTDLLPQIEHIVVLMKENHTFDNYFGMLGRGDGFTLDVHGQPVNSNPDPAGRPVTVHHLSSPWQPWHGLDQHWNASHLQMPSPPPATAGEAEPGHNSSQQPSVQGTTIPGEHSRRHICTPVTPPWTHEVPGPRRIGCRSSPRSTSPRRHHEPCTRTK